MGEDNVDVTRCPCCEAILFPSDQKRVGLAMRKWRETFGKPMKAQAADMGISVGYLCLLEKGVRPWNGWLLLRYRRAMVK